MSPVLVHQKKLPISDRSRIHENSDFSAARPKSHDFGYGADLSAGSIIRPVVLLFLLATPAVTWAAGLDW